MKMNLMICHFDGIDDIKTEYKRGEIIDFLPLVFAKIVCVDLALSILFNIVQYIHWYCELIQII